jgi:hypothetical protein
MRARSQLALLLLPFSQLPLLLLLSAVASLAVSSSSLTILAAWSYARAPSRLLLNLKSIFKASSTSIQVGAVL